MREMMKNRPASYEPRDIFHVDEIGLFYMLLPERSFVAPEVAHKLSKKNKDCTTLLLACFFWGEKLTPVVIDKSRSPRALRNTHIDNLPCKYEWHSRAWMTYDIFQNFLNTTNESMKSGKEDLHRARQLFGRFMYCESSNPEPVYHLPELQAFCNHSMRELFDQLRRITRRCWHRRG